jgi:hypothetical protein
MSKNLQYVAFWTWLISLDVVIFCSTHFPANDVISFFMAE